LRESLGPRNLWSPKKYNQRVELKENFTIAQGWAPNSAWLLDKDRT
jgi:hypothetical protein